MLVIGRYRGPGLLPTDTDRRLAVPTATERYQKSQSLSNDTGTPVYLTYVATTSRFFPDGYFAEGTIPWLTRLNNEDLLHHWEVSN